MLTRIKSSQIRTGNNSEEAAVVSRSGRLVSDTASEAVSELTQETSYDASSGILTLAFSNGQRLRIPGFPTVTSIPAGGTGARGETGADGNDGRPGLDGRDGEAGCTGADGADGATGNTGADGRPGGRGPDGNPGPTGPTGPDGNTGPTGNRGATGATGPTGAPGPTGPTGATGAAGSMPIIVSATAPTDAQAGVLWVNPNADIAALWP